MVAFHDIVIDIVMDNAGFELFSDLCLADFLITTGLASLVRLRVKVNFNCYSKANTKDIGIASLQNLVRKGQFPANQDRINKETNGQIFANTIPHRPSLPLKKECTQDR